MNLCASVLFLGFASFGSIRLISCGQKHWSCGYILLPECYSLASCSEKPKDSLSYTGQLHLHHAYLFHWHCLEYWMAFLMMFQIVSNIRLIEHEWNGFLIGNITVIMIITTCWTTIAHCERWEGGCYQRETLALEPNKPHLNTSFAAFFFNNFIYLFMYWLCFVFDGAQTFL